MPTPTLQSISQTGNTIVLTFDQTMNLGNGNIVISDGHSQAYLSGGRLLNRIVGATDSRSVTLSQGANAGGDDGQVSYSGNTVTITLSSALKAGLSYSVTMNNGALHADSGGADYGILSTTLTHFTVAGGVAPSAPTAVAGAAIHFIDNGDSSSDYVTSVAAQTVTGTITGALGANDFVQVSLDNGAHWHQATTSGNTWTYVGGIETANLGSVSGGMAGVMLARVSNTSALSTQTASQSYVYAAATADTAALTGHTLTLSHDSDSGAFDDDGITQDATKVDVDVLQVHGFHAGDTLRIIDTSNGDMVVGHYVIQASDLLYGSGDYISKDQNNPGFRDSLSVTLDAPLSAGAHNLAAVMVDANGVVSAAPTSAATITVDNIAPVLASSSPTGDDTMVGTDITQLVLQFDEFITIENGATIIIRDDNNADNSQTLTLNSDNVSGGTLTVALQAALTGGTHYTVSGLEVRDLAGNDAHPVLHFTTSGDHPQPAEVYSDFTFSADAGDSDTDLITNVAVQTVSGRDTGLLDAGQTLQVSADGGSTWTDAIAANGLWHADDVTLLSGSHDMVVRLSNGNELYREYLLDTSITSLDGHALSLAVGSDSGRSDSDNITSSVQKVSLNVAGLHGFHAGDKILILDTNNSSTQVGSYVIQSGDLYYGDDYFSVGPQLSGQRESVDIDISTPLGDGYHYLVALLADAAGNVGTPYSGTVTVKVETQAYNSDTLTGNHFIETTSSLTGTLTAAAAEITDQIVEVTLDHGVHWQQATLTGTDPKHANWSLAADLSTQIEYGVRIANPADHVTATAYYLTSRDGGYTHPEYDDITLYAGGGIDYITVGDRAWVNGGGGSGDQIVTGDDSFVSVGNNSSVTTGNGNNTVSTGFNANVTTGNGDDTIYCSTIDSVTIRAGLGNDKLTVNTRVNGLTVGGQTTDIRGVEALHFGYSGNNDLTINSAASVRTFSDTGTLTITAAFAGSHIHLNGLVWISDGIQNNYQSYHSSSNEILLIGQNIAVDTLVGSD
jgi:hypothetical protein